MTPEIKQIPQPAWQECEMCEGGGVKLTDMGGLRVCPTCVAEAANARYARHKSSFSRRHFSPPGIATSAGIMRPPTVASGE